MNDSKKLKWLLIGGITLFILVIVGISVGNIIWNNIYSATFNFMVAPADSKISANDELMKNGMNKMKPGEYEITISHDGFEPETRSVILEKGSIEDVFAILNPNDPSTMDWYDMHEEDAAIASGVVGQEFAEAATEMAEKYTIVEDLPVYNYSYILGYGTCADDGGPDFCVVIRAEFGYRDEAVKYLQDTGKDLGKYYVEIAEYSSPFNKYDFNVPDGLTFEGNENVELNTQVLETESEQIYAAVNSQISNLSNIYDMAIISGVKCYGGGKYCGVKVSIYDEELYDKAETEGEIDPKDTLHDTYRMIIAKIDGNWRVVTGLKFLLDYESNPKLSEDLIRLINEF